MNRASGCPSIRQGRLCCPRSHQVCWTIDRACSQLLNASSSCRRLRYHQGYRTGAANVLGISIRSLRDVSPGFVIDPVRSRTRVCRCSVRSQRQNNLPVTWRIYAHRSSRLAATGNSVNVEIRRASTCTRPTSAPKGRISASSTTMRSLLDLNLPDVSGYEVLRTLRLAKIKTPVLVLSGLAGIEDKVKGPTASGQTTT